MSRRRSPVADALAGALTTIAVFAVVIGVAVAWFTNWPAEMAIWLSGVAAGLLAGPPLRRVLVLAAGKPGRRYPAARRRRSRRR
ncbi:unnamed protein product [[Actinomadura] parvosata subsp. kistnae]|uniref:Uncharacterized protein n=1 Tax=[Actinomadura] parvosata subsp. kistnae TaxID=1909395 RepID=A0A1V0ABI8_9ACTN|nr:hypothetical protein [Nonomuraea sp. ATCC 55076]AQZ67584.1 hypothetical protein BKM31_44475 [Nonomuraea sp. ATCC 55076]SPL94136.1 unnamed protein product [Actinomadura parvosata subsp. kistnae]